MSDENGKSKKTPEGIFYESAVSNHARESLAALVARRERPILVTGERGTGKSTLIRRVIDSLSEQDRPILLAHPRLDFPDVLDMVLKSIRIDNSTSAISAEQPHSMDFVRWCLREESVHGRHVTLFIDEAHDLDMDLLTGLLQLAKEPVQGGPILGLVLIGLPTLETKLAQPVLSDLLRTKPYYFRLRPLNSKETANFMRHFLSTMGVRGSRFSSSDVVTQIWDYSRGVLKPTSQLCFAMLAVMKKRGTKEINAKTVEEATALCSRSPGSPTKSLSSADGRSHRAHQPRTGVGSNAHTDDSEKARPDEHKPAPAHEQAKSEKKPATPSSPGKTPIDRTASLTKVLENLQNRSPDVEASALISEDGLMLASSLPQDLNEVSVGGMSATLLNLGTRAAAELHRGDVQEVIVRGEQGYGVMVSAGRGILLLAMTNKRAKLGLIFFDMRAAIETIKRIL